MSESTICLKPISALLTNAVGDPANYWIPAYQRGYRWTPLQVTQLMDDIWDFIQSSEGGNRLQFYCLQPLVIQPLEDGRLEVVDGQQRLTTIYIILKHLKDMMTMLKKPCFRITFQTRGEANEPFLQNDIDLTREKENVDFYHICQAYRAVQAWCAPRDPMQLLKLLQHLLNDDVSGRNVKVIWFQLGANDTPVDAFTRLNVGKIPLTNDELIRALFLRVRVTQEQDVAARAKSKAIELKIAYEWDILEKALQVDSFWYFLTNEEARPQNRIGFLFKSIAEATTIPADLLHDAYKYFHIFSRRLSQPGANPENQWLGIKEEFMRLEEWFNNPTLYHIVGFLVHEGMELREIRKLSRDRTKREFVTSLRAAVFRRAIKAEPPAGMDEKLVRTAVENRLDDLEYRPGRPNEDIRSILLLFNIATLLRNEKSKILFQFDSFKKLDNFKSAGWDIEHVRSTAGGRPTNYAAQTQWMEHCLGFLKAQAVKEKLIPEVEKFLGLKRQEATEPVFDELYTKVLERFGEKDNLEADNGIANLTLLDARTNRSYKNAPFAVKRQRILSIDQAGVFVPLCTRNVFLKCYSPQVNDAMFWGEQDQDGYVKAITDTLVDFFTDKKETAE